MQKSGLSTQESALDNKTSRITRAGLRRVLERLVPKSVLNSTLPRFVIFGQGRTGSTLLVDLLNRSTDVFCDGEILSRWSFSPSARIAKRVELCGQSVYAFKLLSYQLDMVQAYSRPSGLLEWLEDNAFNVVYLTRDNVVMHALSQIRARQSGFHIHGKEAGDRAKRKVLLSPERAELDWWLTRLNARKRYEQELLAGRRYLTLEYEVDLECSGNWGETLAKISKHVGLEITSQPSTEYQKINRNRLEAIVSNAADIRAWLSNTEYEKYVQ